MKLTRSEILIGYSGSSAQVLIDIDLLSHEILLEKHYKPSLSNLACPLFMYKQLHISQRWKWIHLGFPVLKPVPFP